MGGASTEVLVGGIPIAGVGLLFSTEHANGGRGDKQWLPSHHLAERAWSPEFFLFSPMLLFLNALARYLCAHLFCQILI